MQMKETGFWTANSTFSTGHHKRPRSTLYVPTEEECPIPLKYVDVMRFIKTSLPESKLANTEDYWMKEAFKNYYLHLQNKPESAKSRDWLVQISRVAIHCILCVHCVQALVQIRTRREYMT